MTHNLKLNDSCPLCKAEHLTHLYYEDDTLWVADCLTCHIPMVVLKRHTSKPFPTEQLSMIATLSDYACEVIGSRKFWIDTIPRQIKDHVHYHARFI